MVEAQYCCSRVGGAASFAKLLLALMRHCSFLFVWPRMCRMTHRDGLMVGDLLLQQLAKGCQGVFRCCLAQAPFNGHISNCGR